ncbi:MAG: hypothetical protein OJF62_003670 [Pseudolabrys sp.]|jgi:hypothetical protein|nr:hypothetical protein [Pseudolabrys sp.]
MVSSDVVAGAAVTGAQHRTQLKQWSWSEAGCGTVEPPGPPPWQMEDAGSNPVETGASCGQAARARIVCRAITTIATDPASRLIA